MSLNFLTNGNPLKQYYFHVPKLCLSTMGFWPEKRSNFIWPIFNFTILLIGVLTELHAGLTSLTTNLEKGLDTLCPAGTSAVTLLKMFLVSYYRRDLQYVLKKMQTLLHEENNRDRQSIRKYKNIILNYSLLAARFNFAPFLAGFFTCTAYNLKPLVIAVISWTKGSEVVWETPFNMTLPYIFLHGPLFPLAYIFTAYTGYVTIFSFGGCDAFYFEFCANIAALMELLQEDVRSLFARFDNKLELSFRESEILENGLKQIIRRHNEIIDLTNFFRKRYTVITLAHFVSAGCVIGASIFDLMTYSGFGRLVYVAYTIAALCQLVVYCYGGTLVSENSENLAVVIFGCNWFICNPKLRRMVLMIIIRSQRALTMSVPFFAPSMVTFASIIQTSGSIIALASSFQHN